MPSAPTIVDSGSGVGTITYDNDASFSVTRTTPVAPFDADVRLEVNVIDTDSSAYAEPTLIRDFKKNGAEFICP